MQKTINSICICTVILLIAQEANACYSFGDTSFGRDPIYGSPYTNTLNTIPCSNELSLPVLTSVVEKTSLNNLRNTQSNISHHLANMRSLTSKAEDLPSTKEKKSTQNEQRLGSRIFEAWTQLSSTNLEQKNHSGYAGFEAKGLDVNFGIDLLFKDRWIIGTAFSLGRSDTDLSNYLKGQEIDSKRQQVTFYTSRQSDTWHIDGMLGYAQQENNTTRFFLLPDLTSGSYKSNTASGKFYSSQWFSKIEIGHQIKLIEKTTITPIAGLEWSRFASESYKENIPGNIYSKIKRQRINRTSSNLGTRAETVFVLGSGNSIQPYTQLTWKHEFNNNGINTSRIGIDGTVFIAGNQKTNYLYSTKTTTGQELPKNSYELLLGVLWNNTKGPSIDLQVNTQGSTDFSSHSYLASLHWKL